MNSSHTDIYSLALHDALPIYTTPRTLPGSAASFTLAQIRDGFGPADWFPGDHHAMRSEEHKHELQSHRYLLSCPTRRSSDLHDTTNASRQCRVVHACADSRWVRTRRLVSGRPSRD